MRYNRYNLEKVYLDLSIFIPIIVVNGNIYSVDLESEEKGKFEKRIKKESGLIKEFNYLKMPANHSERYIDFTRLLMNFLMTKKICLTDRSFFPTIFEPVVDVLIISSSNFSELFLKIRDHLSKKLYQEVENLAKNLFLERKEELIRFLVFNWVLSKNSEFFDDFISQSYKHYKELRELKFKFSF